MTAKPRSVQTSRRAQQVVDGFTKTRRAARNENWERSLEKLEQELCQDSPTAEPPTPDHTQIQDVLAYYVFEEQLGSDVQRVYPIVWEHLGLCADCRNVYTALATKQPTKFKTSPAPKRGVKPSRTQSAPAEAAWKKTEQPTNGIHAFLFSPNYIQTLWSPAASTLVLRSTPTQSEILMLADSIRHKEALIHLVAWLEPSNEHGNADQIRLQVTPPRVAGELEARLYWNGKTRIATRVHKHLMFKNLEAPRINSTKLGGSASDDFALEIKISDKKRLR